MELPKKINILEVGPRDGLQNLENWVPTDIKIKLIQKLVSSGISAIEINSFVHPKAIPQMKDANIVAKAVVDEFSGRGLRIISLAPNLIGAKNAYTCGVREITYVTSVSEKHNLANVNRTIEQSLDQLANIKKELPNIKIRLAAATAFGCPFQGKIEDKLVIDLIEKARKIGISTVSVADTIGIANPKQVYDLFNKLIHRFPEMPLSFHIHDTRGMGMANAIAAMEAGITTIETSIGGLGGCPFAPGAAGNTATEDMVNMLKEMGIETGIDVKKLIEISKWLEKSLEMKFTGHMVHVNV